MLAKSRHLQWVFTLFFVVIFTTTGWSWQLVSELPTLRVGKASAVVDSKIYLIGGINSDENLGGGAPPLSRVDVYDTLTNTWERAADMLTPRIAPRAVVFSSEIYVFGGYTRTAIRGEPYKKTVEAYDTRTNTWVKKRDMSILRRNFGAAVVDGKIYIIGGSVHDKKLNQQVSTDLVEVYDPLTNRWEKRADMPTKRSRINVAVINDKVYVIGGQTLAHGLGPIDTFLKRIEEYNPRTNQWRRLPDMPMFKFSFATVVVDNEIWTLGGYDLDNGLVHLNTVDVYNPAINKWWASVPMLMAKTTTAVVANGTIYLLGGRGKSRRFSPEVEAFDTGFRAVDAKGKYPTRWGEIKKPD